jgi:hypothetical protein
LYAPEKKEFAKIDGEWNGTMNIKYNDKESSETLFDTKTSPIIKKIVRPLAVQNENESRRYVSISMNNRVMIMFVRH